jgi:hypothetical protein
MSLIHDRLCKWLGIWDLNIGIAQAKSSIVRLNLKYAELDKKVRALEEGVAKALLRTNAVDPRPDQAPALNDPDYDRKIAAWDERRLESQRIEKETIARLYTEQAARDRHNRTQFPRHDDPDLDAEWDTFNNDTL